MSYTYEIMILQSLAPDMRAVRRLWLVQGLA